MLTESLSQRNSVAIMRADLDIALGEQHHEAVAIGSSL